MNFHALLRLVYHGHHSIMTICGSDRLFMRQHYLRTASCALCLVIAIPYKNITLTGSQDEQDEEKTVSNPVNPVEIFKQWGASEYSCHLTFTRNGILKILHAANSNMGKIVCRVFIRNQNENDMTLLSQVVVYYNYVVIIMICVTLNQQL